MKQKTNNFIELNPLEKYIFGNLNNMSLEELNYILDTSLEKNIKKMSICELKELVEDIRIKSIECLGEKVEHNVRVK